MFSVSRLSCQDRKLTLNQSVITTFTLVKQWSSKWLKSTTSSKTLLFRIKRLLKRILKSRKKKSSANLKKDRYLKVLLKTSPHTEYSLILAVLTDLFTLQTFLGLASTTRTRLLS